MLRRLFPSVLVIVYTLRSMYYNFFWYHRNISITASCTKRDSMESLYYYLLLATVPLLLILLLSRHQRSRDGGGSGKKLPPSPPSLPIIGHLHLLKEPRHLSVAALAQRYGPIVFLRLGNRPAIIISSPEAFEEVLVKNDAVFANHPATHAGHALSYGGTSMFFASYGPHFSTLRRLTAVELFSVRRLSASAAFRREELLCMVRRMVAAATSGGGRGEVVFKERIYEMNYNMMTKMVAGKRFFGEDVEEAEAELAARFRELLREIFNILYTFNPRDFFPAVAWADLMGVDKKVEGIRVRLDGFLTDLVEEHRRKRITDGAAPATTAEEEAMEENRTLIDVMLSMQEADPEGFTDEILKGQVMTMLTAGSDTAAVVTEAVMLMLLCHEEVMKKAREEIDANIVGRFLEESDLTQLPYLHCVVKEAMRLAHFFGGFPPHSSSKECTLKGYHVPQNTMVMMNFGSLKKDPMLWDDPMTFKPERFVDHSGWKDGLRYFPFGLGRRGCPGENLAVRMVPYAVGFFVQCFDWDPMTPEEVDLSGLMGTTQRIGNPVVARYKIREDMFD